MFKISWDKETGGILLGNRVTDETLGISPRPVFHEELDLIGLDRLGWRYPKCQEPLLWAQNKRYFYRGEFVFEVKGANIYDAPTVVFAPGMESLSLQPVDVTEMLRRNADMMFLLESEAIEFIRDVFVSYSSASRSVERVKANQMDFEAMRERIEKKTKRKMAIVREDCDSFDIMPLETARAEGRRVYQGTKVDRFIASFSGGKDSQVILDLCTRAIPSADFEVFYSDTGYELPSSLELYEETKRYYGEKFPNLKFHITRNHESVLNYWDKIGTPSDTHRWCCTVMKTAPLYRALKLPNSNKQAKVLAFEGVRAEESTRRSGYLRIGKGVKHSTTINARPILRWNTCEIFLYLFSYELPINPAYRHGLTRVGCIVCPYASEWNECLARQIYSANISPFISRIKEYTRRAGVEDVDDYIKQGNWKRRASGNLLEDKTKIEFKVSANSLRATIENFKSDVLMWLIPIGQVSYVKKESGYRGQLRYKQANYQFRIEILGSKLMFELIDCTDAVLIGLVRRSLYKTGYCIRCEVCEVECPTGALSIIPEFSIDANKCVHCQKCLNFHDKGCVVANSLYQTMNSKANAQTSLDRYNNFGLKEEWLRAFFSSEDFWESDDHGLNVEYQVPAFQKWLKDAEIINSTQSLTLLGQLLRKLFSNNHLLVWEIVWINLCCNSVIANWFSSKVGAGQTFSKEELKELLQSEYPEYKDRTVKNAIYQLLRTLKESPIGGELKQGVQVKKGELEREAYEELSVEAVAYSIYKYAQAKGISFMRVSDFYRPEETSGPYREFGISESELKKKLRALSSEDNRVLIAELNMGLDHITLREDLTPVSALELLTK